MKKLEIIIALCVIAFASAFAGIGAVTVSTSETQVLPERWGRAWVILQNTGTNDVWVKWSAETNAVTTNTGYRLIANGGSISIMASGGANPCQNRITAISTVTNATLSYQEGNER